MLIALRVGLYIYTISVRAVKCALFGLLYVLLPAHTILTIVGTVLWSKMKNDEFKCVSSFFVLLLNIRFYTVPSSEQRIYSDHVSGRRLVPSVHLLDGWVYISLRALKVDKIPILLEMLCTRRKK